MGCFFYKRKKKCVKNIKGALLELSQIESFSFDSKNTSINKIFLGKKKKPDGFFIFEKLPYKREKAEQILSLSRNIENENSSYNENNINNINLNEESFNQGINNNKSKTTNKKRDFIISPNIVNNINELDLIECYSFELISKILSFEVKKGSKKEEYFHLILKNNGKIKWPKGETFLRYHAKNCPELYLEQTPIGECDIGEKISILIKFGNLDNCKYGNYQAIFHLFIKGRIIGEPILVFFKII